MRPSRPLVIGLIALFAIISASVVPAVAADGGSSVTPKAPSKFSSAIESVIDAEVPAVPGDGITNGVGSDYDNASAWFAAGLLRETQPGWLQVYIHVDGEITAGLRTALTNLGVDIEMESGEQGIVQASVPYGVLQALSAVDGVRVVTEPSYGVFNAGTSLTEGDAIMNFDDLRAAQGVDGTGVTVGVISDGIAGLQTAVASGDLPATSETRSSGVLTATSGGVIAQSFRSDGNLEGFGSIGAEGTAMLEIVHDIAPGAQLRFANFSTHLEFMAAVDFLASVSDVVVDDIGFFGRQTDGTSDVSTNTSNALNDNSNPIRSYVTSVGNSATRHYEGAFAAGIDGMSATGFPGALHAFGPTSNTTDALNLGTQAYSTVRLTSGQAAVVWLVWAEAAGASTADYDLFLQDSGGAIVASSTAINATTGSAAEAVGVAYSGPGSIDLKILIQNYDNVSLSRNLELVVFPGTTELPNGTYLNYNTIAGSVGAQSDAGGGVLSVGAINASDAGANDIADYSSRGPTGDGRIKPDITAIDGVDVSGAGGFPSTFSGTSAAAPHVAGLSALLLEHQPSLKAGEAGDDPAADRTGLRTAILDGAVDLGVAGADNVYGYGRADGLGAAVELGPGAPVVGAGADQGVVDGTVVGISATFSDDSGDTHTATIHWGDGSAIATATVDQGLNTVTGSHTFGSTGLFTVVVTVTDSTGRSGTDSLVVTVVSASSGGDAGVSVAVGVDHTCAVTSASGLQCWGRNDYGQLGIGVTTSGATTAPVDVAALGSSVAAVDQDLAHTCALTAGGAVKCWGFNSGDYLPTPVDVIGLGSGVASISVGGVHACAVTTAGGLKCWAPPYGGAATPPEASGTGFAGVSVGGRHTCALTKTGGVYCWGDNNHGQLGSGPTSGFAAVAAGYQHTCALTMTGGVQCWGRNLYAQLGNGTTASSSVPVDVIGLTSGVVAISAGRYHTCAVTVAGGVQCWGSNSRSELGDGTTTTRSVPVDVVGLANDIAGVAAGGRFTCAETSTGGLQCWGNNNYGQLGNGTTAPNYVPPIVIGPVDVIGFPTGSSPSSSGPVAPVVNAGADQALDLGVLTVINATFTDDNGGGTFTATIDWGDGSAIANAALGAGGAATGSYDYPSEGTFTATVTVTDGTDLSGSDSLVVTVTKPPAVSPEVDAGVDVTVGEGAALALSFGFSDAAWETHEATVVWGDGTTEAATVDQSSDTGAATHTYLDDGVFVVSASVSDDIGLSGIDIFTVTVTNVAPDVSAIANLTVGDALLFPVVLATFTDDGASDTHTAIVDWGDGTVEAATVDQDAGTISGTHPFYLLGAHVATVTVTDDDGAYTTVDVPFLVFNGPSVPGVTGWGMLLLGAALLALVVHQRRRVLARQHSP